MKCHFESPLDGRVLVRQKTSGTQGQRAYNRGPKEECVMRTKYVELITALALTCVLVWSSGCKPNSTSEQTAPAVKPWPKIRIGYLPVAAELPLFVAVEKGFLQQEGITYELVRVPSSNEMGNSATADKIDILAGAAMNVVTDIGHVSGKKHLLFAVNPYSNRPGHVTDHLIARKGSGIASVKDLKGRKIAALPGSVRVLVFLVLEKYGIPRNSYEYLELLPKDWEPSLQAGAIDAVVALEPSATQIIKDGVGTSILPGFYAELMPDMPLSGHWVSADFYSRTDKRLLSAFLNAYDKAIAFCREHPAEAKAYLVKYANVREDILADVNLNPWQKLSELDVKQIQAYLDLLSTNNGIQGNPRATDYILPDTRR
jgi:ABC-type nitrate/sulfonate/bicarbonate transport system substrate-binding protein